MNQAKKGGEKGLNGEQYKGGQFLPSSERTVKGAVKIKASSGKKEIAPFVWQVAPADDMLSIYDRISHYCIDNRRACEFVKGQGFVALQLAPDKFTAQGLMLISVEPHICPMGEQRLAWVKMLIERFNNGERWFLLSEDPFHYLNLDAAKS